MKEQMKMNKPLSEKEFKRRMGAALLALRKARGENQTEFAYRCGSSQASICAYERGRMIPGVRLLLRIIEITGTDAGEFFADLVRGES